MIRAWGTPNLGFRVFGLGALGFGLSVQVQGLGLGGQLRSLDLPFRDGSVSVVFPQLNQVNLWSPFSGMEWKIYCYSRFWLWSHMQKHEFAAGY